jgi:hypothetical protein
MHGTPSRIGPTATAHLTAELRLDDDHCEVFIIALLPRSIHPLLFFLLLSRGSTCQGMAGGHEPDGDAAASASSPDCLRPLHHPGPDGLSTPILELELSC